MAWRLIVAEAALTQLEKLDRRTADRLLGFMEERVAARASPRDIGKALQGNPGHWGYRVGDWRIVANITDAELTITMLRVGNRSDIYKRMRQGRR